jgi:methylphosphotriester-DNA--protein-cysteine methyltransferase
MPAFSTNSSRWAALQSRNPLAHDAFIYSVITTKIYCRPTCSSRLARRANITFHITAAEAEADGFRPCKRCHPDSKTTQDDPQKIAVAKACELINKEAEGGGKWNVKALATEVGLTESHFCRVFKKVVGITVGEYRTSLLLKSGKMNGGFNESPKTLVGEGEGAAQNFALLIPTLDPIWESSEYEDLSSSLNAGPSRLLQDSGSSFDVAGDLSTWEFNLANVSVLEFDVPMQGHLPSRSQLSSTGSSEEDTFEFVQFFSSQESIECS